MTDADIAAILPDRYWQQLYAFLAEQYRNAGRLVVPSPINQAFVGAVCSQDLTNLTVDAFDAIAIHKGDYTAFPADFLYPVLIQYRPVFANEVFIVMAPADAGGNVDRDHIGALTGMIAWARAHATPAIVRATLPPQITLAPDEALARMTRLIARDLVKPVGCTGLATVAETALPFAGTRWFWGDDAAKVAELFCLPALRADAPNLADQLIDTILSLSPDGIIQRRIGPAEVKIEAETATDFRVLGTFVITFGDVSRGRIRQAIRFNDGRTRPIVCFVPGMLECEWRGRRLSCDIAASIFIHSVEPQGDRVILRHVSTLRHPDDATRELATMTCTYTLAPGRSAVGFDMVVTPSRFVTLKDLVVTSGLGELDELGHFDAITLMDGAGDTATIPAPASLPLIEAPAYFCLQEAHVLPGHAVGVHVVPGHIAPIEVSGAVEANRLTTLHWRYRGRSATRRKPFAIHDARLVTTGGYYDRAAEYRTLVQEEDSTWCRDPSMSYDIGVELNAVATWLFFAVRGDYGVVSTKRVTALRAWYDRHLALYLDHLRPDEPNGHERIFVRGLAFVILSLDTIARAYADAGYRTTADRLTKVLLGTEVAVAGADDAGIFGSGLPEAPWRPELDSQCAALLVLARMACAPAALAEVSSAITRGLAALRIATPAESTYGNDPLDHPTIVIGRDRDDDELIDTGFWTYKLGLALRAFHLIKYGVTSGRIDLPAQLRVHLEQLDRTARDALLYAAECRDDVIEVRTSFNAGETNSETQPWVALGLVPHLDQAILGVAGQTSKPLLFFQFPYA